MSHRQIWHLNENISITKLEVHSYSITYLFILGYCSSTITKVFAGYEDNSRALKTYMLNLQVNTPPPLAASIERPNREEAINSFISRYNRSSLVNKRLACPSVWNAWKNYFRLKIMSLLWLKWSCAIWYSLELDTWKKTIQEKRFLKTEDSEFCFNNANVETFKTVWT